MPATHFLRQANESLLLFFPPTFPPPDELPTGWSFLFFFKVSDFYFLKSVWLLIYFFHFFKKSKDKLEVYI